MYSYLRCFYWALLTVATIHNLDERTPSDLLQYFLDIVGYLVGVFVMANIIGEVSRYMVK